MGEHVFRTVDELLEYLDQQPRASLTGGIVVRRGGWNRPPHDLMERLTTYCASRDVDLISHAWDQIADTYHWLVRASDSAYRD